VRKIRFGLFHIVLYDIRQIARFPFVKKSERQLFQMCDNPHAEFRKRIVCSFMRFPYGTVRAQRFQYKTQKNSAGKETQLSYGKRLQRSEGKYVYDENLRQYVKKRFQAEQYV